MRIQVLAYPSLGELVTVEVTLAGDMPDGSEGPLAFWGRTHRVPLELDMSSQRDLVAYVGEQLIALAYEAAVDRSAAPTS